jgi:hypothetical protein
MKSDLLKPDTTLDHVIAERRPMSLYASGGQWWVALLGAAAIVAFYAVVHGWQIALAIVVLAGVLLPPFVTRRIDIDTDGITLVPLLPILPTQRLRFASLGPFEVRSSRFAGVRAIVDEAATYRVGGVLRRGEVSIAAASYKSAFGDAALRADQLRDLLERYRGAPAPEVHEDPALMLPENRLRGRERILLAVGLVVILIFVAAAQTLVSH